jgi:UDP-N-acetylmuramate dehydrogenase
MSWELAGASLKLIMAGMEPIKDAPLAKHGYWRVGGPADLLVDVHDGAQLAAVMETDLPVTVLGNGSNLLVADAGIRGIVIRLKGNFRALAFRDPKDPAGLLDHLDSELGIAVVGGGMMNTVLLNKLNKLGLGGLGCLAGVPGTIGGAIRMNAGTRLGEIGDTVAFVRVMLPNGHAKTLTPDDIDFRYRRATLPTGAIVTRVGVWVSKAVHATEQADIREHLNYRKQTQPLDTPSCGSTFKNPPGDAAGRLIDAAGLKGSTEGGAQISEKHANFFVNTGHATAADLHTLIKRARDTVAEQFNVTLEPEVHAVGDWPEGSWPL